MALKIMECNETKMARDEGWDCEVLVFFAAKRTGGFVCLEADPSTEEDAEWVLDGDDRAVRLDNPLAHTGARFKCHTEFHKGRWIREKPKEIPGQMKLEGVPDE